MGLKKANSGALKVFSIRLEMRQWLDGGGCGSMKGGTREGCTPQGGVSNTGWCARGGGGVG